MADDGYRIERDSMGEMRVPADSYWGAQTQRAIDNFPVSGRGFPPAFIRSLGRVKAAAAVVNVALGELDPRLGEAVATAAREVAAGTLEDQFVVDLFQTGSGTSTNMNANEVIANRANELLGGTRGSRSPVHPNDHVNRGQSSNDVIPTTLHVAAALAIRDDLLPALAALHQSLSAKAHAFHGVLKMGRTHLQDATPVRLGQELDGYAAMVERGAARLESALERMAELAIGGTAVGTGINTHPEFGRRVAAHLARETGFPFVEAGDHFEAQSARDAAVELSGALKTVAVSLYKVANDVRFLGSGPRAGLGELRLPPLQPGSSIMPGKVNPVIPEVVMQVAAQVIGNDAAITVGGLSGNFELNVMVPVITRNLLESISLLSAAATLFAQRCIDGLDADRERCGETVERSLALATALVPALGYDAAAEVAKEAWSRGRSVREVAREKGLLPPEELERLLDPSSMT
jgi:fumarate hydratase class II